MASYEKHLERVNQSEIDLEHLLVDVIEATRFQQLFQGEIVNLTSCFVAGCEHFMGDDVEHLEKAIGELGHGIYKKLCQNKFYNADNAHELQLYSMTKDNALLLVYDDEEDTLQCLREMKQLAEEEFLESTETKAA